MNVSEFIEAEWSICLVAAYMGMVLAFEYDCIRVFRRVIRHKRVWTMSVEDILYWIVAAFQVFGLIYEQGDGVVRGFLIVMMLLGAVLYRYAFGRHFVVYAAKIINFVLRPLKNVLRSVTMFIKKKKVAIVNSHREKQALRKLRKTAKKRSKDNESGVEKREGTKI